ncbi:MAG: RebB family R body protein [Inquilinus limosus]|uniref:RebB family R body protein n=1 Tax=Inquilinus limosus TaxID=171674 RepID=A0A952FHL0_9PROT|nr:RebB family R body protein [Inquilinus limosus]
MAETDKPGHPDAVVMVEVPVQAIATLYQAVGRAAGGAAPGAGVEVDSPAQAVALLYQVAGRAAGLDLQNAVQNQQVLNQIASAVVSKAIQMVMAMGSRAAVMAAVPPDAAVVGEAPAMLTGTVYQTMAHSTGIGFETAVAAQPQQDTGGQAAANQGVMQIYSLDTTADAVAAKPSRRLDDTD